MLDFFLRTYDPSDRGYAVGRIGYHEWYVGWNRTRFSMRIRSLTYRADVLIQTFGDSNSFPSRLQIEEWIRILQRRLPELEQSIKHFVGGMASTVYLVEFDERYKIQSIRGNLSDYKYILSTAHRSIELVELDIQTQYFTSPIPRLIRLERLCRICKIHAQ